MLNECQFIGRCGQDIEIRYTTGGNAVGNVNIACSEKYTDKQGNKQENTEWIRLVFWGRLAEIMQQYTRKGSLIYVRGRMRSRSWEDRDGQKRYTTEVHVVNMLMLDTKSSGSQPPPPRDDMMPPGSKPATGPDNVGEPLPGHGEDEPLSEPVPPPASCPADDDDLPF